MEALLQRQGFQQAGAVLISQTDNINYGQKTFTYQTENWLLTLFVIQNVIRNRCVSCFFGNAC